MSEGSLSPTREAISTAAAAGASGAAESSAAADPAELLLQQTTAAIRNAPLAIVGLLANALVAVYVLWSTTPHELLWGWLGAWVVLTALRVAGHLRLRGGLGTPEGGRRWLRGYWVGTFLSGLWWGSVALCVPSQELTHLVFVAFLTGGLCAGCVAAYAALAWLPHAFILPATFSVGLAFALRGDELSYTMAAMIVLFAALLLIMTHGFHGAVREQLSLRLQNVGLRARISRADSGVERLNRELTANTREREQAQAALKESEERFRSLVESATDAIGFMLDGKLHYANEATYRLSGYRPEEIVGLPIKEVLSGGIVPKDEVIQRYEKRMEGEELVQPFETRMRRKDGTLIDVSFSTSLISLEGKVGVMSIVKDITEHKRSERELRAAKEQAESATRVKDQFVSLLAHDLRGPLNSVFVLLAMLERDKAHPLSPDQMQILRAVNEQGEITLRMIEDLLSVSRLQSGSVKPVPRFVDASGLITTALVQLRPQANQKHVGLLNEVPPHTRLYTDADMFGKVLHNLLSNAIKFCRPGERIRLYIPEHRPTTVAVEDNGPGVDSMLLPNLFRHDIKTSTPGSSGERGTGLGLPLSQGLMHTLGGRITVQSAPGEGSTFFAELPVVRPRVLLLSQDADLPGWMKPHLERMDAELRATGEPEAALAAIAAEDVHVLICDTAAGNGDLSLVQQIRQDPRGRVVPLVLLTSAAETGTPEGGYRLGADEVVFKPLQGEEFATRLRPFIG